jgi:hypothetical protein
MATERKRPKTSAQATALTPDTEPLQDLDPTAGSVEVSGGVGPTPIVHKHIAGIKGATAASDPSIDPATGLPYGS